MAIKWDRPSILLAVQKTKLGQDKATKALDAKLKEIGQAVQYLAISNELPDAPHQILATSNIDKTVFFISNIDWGGGDDGKDAYRALNIYRELFIENRVRAVFWLTSNEAANLPHYAPDFWAFRHRVIEFISPRSARDVLPVGALYWHAQGSIATYNDEPKDGITARQEILARLPENGESLSTRVELLYGIGYLYWVLGDITNARKTLIKGMDLSGDHQLPWLKAQILNGLAIVHYETEEYEKALTVWKEAIEDNPDDGHLLVNLGIVSSVLGRNQEAISLGKKAVRINPSDPQLWIGLGHLYETIGKLDEAIASFLKAKELAPMNATHFVPLAVSYSLVGRIDKSIQVLNLARTVAGARDIMLINVYEQGIRENAEQALASLKEAVRSKQISKIAIERDPNLNRLFDASRLETMFKE